MNSDDTFRTAVTVAAVAGAAMYLDSEAERRHREVQLVHRAEHVLAQVVKMREEEKQRKLAEIEAAAKWEPARGESPDFSSSAEQILSRLADAL